LEFITNCHTRTVPTRLRYDTSGGGGAMCPLIYFIDDHEQWNSSLIKDNTRDDVGVFSLGNNNM
jgi:hypothetical protein